MHMEKQGNSKEFYSIIHQNIHRLGRRRVDWRIIMVSFFDLIFFYFQAVSKYDTVSISMKIQLKNHLKSYIWRCFFIWDTNNADPHWEQQTLCSVSSFCFAATSVSASVTTFKGWEAHFLLCKRQREYEGLRSPSQNLSTYHRSWPSHDRPGILMTWLTFVWRRNVLKPVVCIVHVTNRSRIRI